MKRTNYINEKIRFFKHHIPEPFHKQIRFLMYEYYEPIINNLNIKQLHYHQTGGKHIKTGTFTQLYKGYKFQINVEKTKYDTLISILTQNDKLEECAIINVDAKLKVAYISNMSNYKDCATPTVQTLNPSTGSTILNFILGFLKQNKEGFKINRLLLKDSMLMLCFKINELILKFNSLKACRNCPEKIELGSMYMLLHGNTWYGKYGFRPYDFGKMQPDKYNIKLYRKNQQIISKILVKDTNILQYIKEAVNIYNIKDIDINIIISGTYKYKNKSLSQLLRALMKDYDKYCYIFSYIQPKLFKELGLSRFHGLGFYLDL